MKSRILLLALTAAVLSSCTTAYQTGQTPDDVYYSPSRPQEEYVQSEKDEDYQYRRRNDSYFDSYYEDQFLRMKVRNRYRWSDIDDPYYYSRRYYYTSFNHCYFGNPWTPYSYWNNYYNPYYQNHVIISPATATYKSPRVFNLNTYNSNALTNSNYSNTNKARNYNGSYYNNNNGNNTYSAPRNNRNKSNNESNSGRILRDIFNGNNNNSGSSNNNSSSSSNNNSSSSSSSSSGSSSSSSNPAPVRKF